MTLISEEKRVSVCFVSPKAYPLFDPQCEGVFGGAEVDLYHLGMELAKDKRFFISFVTADYGQRDDQIIKGIRLIKSLDFGKNSLSGACKIWKALKKANAEIYVIKTASSGVPLLAKFCSFYKRKFIYRTAHQDECDGTYMKQHPLLGRMFVKALRRADIVFAQNTSDAEKLKSLYGIDSSVIANGHYLPDLTEQFKRDSILWVGRSADFKQPQLFLELPGKFPNEKFIMICPQAVGDTEYESLKSRADAIDNLQLIQRVPFGEIDSYFKRAKVFVNTSRAEGFANTFIQACKWGGAIASLNVNPDDFLTRYSCGVVCGGSMEHLVEGLAKLLDKDRYIEIGQNGRKYVEDNHDITKIIELYKKAFEQ